MALEDFEKHLIEERVERDRSERHKRKRSSSPRDPSEKYRHRHHRHHDHHGSRRHGGSRERHDETRKRKSSRHYEVQDFDEGRQRHRRPRSRSRSRSAGGTKQIQDGSATGILKAREEGDVEKPERMSWMEAPSEEIEHVRSRRPKTPPGYFRKGTDTKASAEYQEESEERKKNGSQHMKQRPEVDYTFGDAGSNWRMKKLRGVFREAKEGGRHVDDIAFERYGDFRSFDEAREEEAELDRRAMYPQHERREKPTGELYDERKSEAKSRGPINKEDESSEDEFELARGQTMKERSPPSKTLSLDQTRLDKLQSITAKSTSQLVSGNLDAKENSDNTSAGAVNIKEPEVVVLNKMENRMLAGGRKGEVNTIDNKRGRERGLVEENEDMSIEDMVRQERRTKNQFGGEGRAFAERIAKDGKFDNDLDYMDENAAKLAKSVQRSGINLRNGAISDFKKMKRILDSCPLCTHEDTGTPPQAPVVSLATRTYLTLPTSPEITPFGYCASIVPTQHRLNLLQCDDDEWEEIRNFMKSLTRCYYSMKPKRSVIFYENAAHESRKRHASMEAVPLPVSVAEDISQYFKEAILSADEEWTQHKKVIDTLKKSEEAGFGKNAFRKTMVSELPYFHVWFRLDGGLGHVIEDSRRWPKGDLFAREIIGGVLDVWPETIKKQGRWRKDDPDMQERVKNFRKNWEPWDWTKILMEAQ